MTYFFDRNFGKSLPQALRVLGVDVEWYADHFGERKERFDDDWLTVCGRRGWIALVHDRGFLSKSVEREAIVQHKVGCFVIGGAGLKNWPHKTGLLAKAWDGIQERSDQEPTPFMFQVNADGSFRRLYPPLLP